MRTYCLNLQCLMPLLAVFLLLFGALGGAFGYHGVLGSVSRVGDPLLIWLVLGYYLGGMVTGGRFWVGESRVWVDFVGEWLLMGYGTFVFGQIRGICWKYSYAFSRC